MCVFSASLCHIVDAELRLGEKLTSCESIYFNLVKNISQVDNLPESAWNDIKVAGQVSSTDVVFKSAMSANAVAGAEPQYDSISQTSSLGSSTSLSTTASTDSPGGTSSSFTDSGDWFFAIGSCRLIALEGSSS